MPLLPLVLLAAPLVALAGVPLAFWAAARPRQVEAADAPVRPVALVLGARLDPLGRPTLLLEARLETALALVRAARAERLLLSGLADEVEAMRRWALEHGLGSQTLLLDRHGTRTVVSLLNARATVRDAPLLVVTNPFHVPRTLWLARRMGLDALGVPARPDRPLRVRTRLRNHLRELAAQGRALVEPLPR